MKYGWIVNNLVIILICRKPLDNFRLKKIAIEFYLYYYVINRSCI